MRPCNAEVDAAFELQEGMNPNIKNREAPKGVSQGPELVK